MENSPLLFYASEIPRFDSALVASTEEQVDSQLVPTDDINVLFVCPVNASRALFASYPDIPNLDCLVGGTRSEDGGFGRTPLQILYRRGMSGEGL